jgi:hypothetical protein
MFQEGVCASAVGKATAEIAIDSIRIKAIKIAVLSLAFCIFLFSP